jgi:hypothetical protein
MEPIFNFFFFFLLNKKLLIVYLDIPEKLFCTRIIRIFIFYI